MEGSGDNSTARKKARIENPGSERVATSRVEAHDSQPPHKAVPRRRDRDSWSPIRNEAGSSRKKDSRSGRNREEEAGDEFREAQTQTQQPSYPLYAAFNPTAPLAGMNPTAGTYPNSIKETHHQDDQYEYECKQRALRRKARHGEKIEQGPPSALPVVNYSDHEAVVMVEKLDSEETFQQASSVLITWLERGDCNKRNSANFYSMIESTDSHVWRLWTGKRKYQDELNEAEMMWKQHMHKILLQFNEIGKVINAASLQKVRDHFTKGQRKNIDFWKKQFEEMKNAYFGEYFNNGIEDKVNVGKACHGERERSEHGYDDPPAYVDYSDHEAEVMVEKLRSEEKFQQASSVLINWLKRGECNQWNSAYFYSMIQSTYSHVRRLRTEKQKYEDELDKAKMMWKQHMQKILLQFNEIGKVFNAASLQKVWDHFTKGQRKNIELWEKQMEQIKNACVDEVLDDRIEDEMDVSEDEVENSAGEEGGRIIKTNKGINSSAGVLNRISEENDSLRCQLEAFQNDQDLKDQFHALQEAVQKIQEIVTNMSQKRIRDEAELKELRAFKMKSLGNERK